jgi:predicted nucleic acid-binding protein
VKILLDTNVVLDVLLKRPRFYQEAAPLMALAEKKVISACSCATSVTTIYYLTRRQAGNLKALEEISSLLKIFSVAPVDGSVLIGALRQGFSDFEDAVIYESAVAVGADAIITRNVSDFKTARLPVYAPQDFITLMAETSD